MWNYITFPLIFIKIYQWSKKKKKRILFPPFRGNFWTLNPVPLSVFMPIPHCLDYYNFTVNFAIEKFESFNCFLFQNCFGGSESFAFPCNSHIQNLEKNNEFFHRFLLTRILYEIRYAIVFILLTIKVMILTDSLSIDFFIHRFFCCLNLFFFVSTYKWSFFFLYLCVATK